MKGQVTIEELIAFSVYIALLSMLISASFHIKDTGEEWSQAIELRAEAGSLARTEDAFHNSNLYNPDEWVGGGAGYVGLREGEREATAPILAGITEAAKGEPI